MSTEAELVAVAHELLETQLDVVKAMLALKRPEDAEAKAAAVKVAAERFQALDDVRRRLRLLVAGDQVVYMPNHDMERGVINEALRYEMPLDKYLASRDIDVRVDFDWEDIEPIAEDHLMGFSEIDYAYARVQGAVLVVRAGELPGDLLHFIDEIQECFAFERHTAVYALCRVALEAALLHVYRLNGLDHPDTSNSMHVRERINGRPMKPYRKKFLTEDPRLYSDLTLDDFSPTLDQMITRLCWLSRYSAAKVGDEWLSAVMHRIRDRGNSLLHANRTAGKESAVGMMDDLFRALHVLYEVEPHLDGASTQPEQ